ncbi:hypothetical protein P8629_07000 [Hydrogenovibrio sp. 3SP14C1]|uniref:hypothetical protein n=1 Tax=Hydrogenovibrio sp. 3SP14C1 TaxID=3038774 RepID=UPI002417288D|nr:hypothetical protein [Hydrogenovibrio sp. 3SP14C1]MDG4812753.1 hypothetical protein [Hydrogenovibrio sp. 3SP14C1]
MSWLEDIYKVSGVLVEGNAEKPAPAVENAVTPVQEPVKGTAPDGGTVTYSHAPQGNDLLKWGMIGGGVLVFLLIVVLVMRGK